MVNGFVHDDDEDDDNDEMRNVSLDVVTTDDGHVDDD